MSAPVIRCSKLLALAASVFSASAGCHPASVLRSIESYTPPPYPASQYLDRETYDYRLRHGTPVPATLADTLVNDVWQRMQMDIDLKGAALLPVTSDNVRKAIRVYLDRAWTRIAGLRPWTHWHFIRDLTVDERSRLADEIAAYTNRHGVRDPDAPPDTMDCSLVLKEHEVQWGNEVHFTIVIKGVKGGRRFCLSHIRDRPHRWILRQEAGADMWSGPAIPIRGDPYNGAPVYVDLREQDSVNVTGSLWIHPDRPEGDCSLVAAISHWSDHNHFLNTWPKEDAGCWQGNIVSNDVKLRVTARGGGAEPPGGTDAAGEAQGRPEIDR